MDTKALRREVRKSGPARRGRRFPEDLRQRVSAAVRQLREEGAGYVEIGQALGISAETARRMLSERARTQLVPVHVVAAPQPTLVLTGPHGVRVEGLSVEQVALVLRALSS